METQALGDIRIDRIVEFEKPFFPPISFIDAAVAVVSYFVSFAEGGGQIMRVIGLFCALAAIAASTLFASGGPTAAQGDLVAAGEKVFVNKCERCHAIGAPTKFKRPGPHLNDLFGRKPASLPDYKKYSEGLVAFGQDKVWDEATLTTFLHDPQGVVRNTKMAFLGLKTDEEIKAVLAYLATFDLDGAAPK